MASGSCMSWRNSSSPGISRERRKGDTHQPIHRATSSRSLRGLVCVPFPPMSLAFRLILMVVKRRLAYRGDLILAGLDELMRGA